MICYQDMTFCGFFNDCVHKDVCGRALTEEIRREAAAWWGSVDAPICTFVDKPGCYEEVEDKNEKKA